MNEKEINLIIFTIKADLKKIPTKKLKDKEFIESVQFKIGVLEDYFKQDFKNLKESDLEREEHVQRLEGCVSDLQEEQQAFIDVCQTPCSKCKLNIIKEILYDIGKEFLLEDAHRWNDIWEKIETLRPDTLRNGIDYEKVYLSKDNDAERMAVIQGLINHEHLLVRQNKEDIQKIYSEIIKEYEKISKAIEDVSESIEDIGDWDTKEDLVGLVNQTDGYITTKLNNWRTILNEFR